MRAEYNIISPPCQRNLSTLEFRYQRFDFYHTFYILQRILIYIIDISLLNQVHLRHNATSHLVNRFAPAPI